MTRGGRGLTLCGRRVHILSGSGHAAETEDGRGAKRGAGYGSGRHSLWWGIASVRPQAALAAISLPDPDERGRMDVPAAVEEKLMV